MSPALQADSLLTEPPGKSFLMLATVLFTVLLNIERGIFKPHIIIVIFFTLKCNSSHIIVSTFSLINVCMEYLLPFFSI